MNITQKNVLNIPSLKRNNLVEMVFESMQQNILSGNFQDGDQLPTQEILAQQFGVSRTVMREALHKLASLGFIESQQGRGTFVRSPNARTVMSPMFDALLKDETSTREIVETRYYLEGIIGRRAAQRATADNITTLEGFITQMDACLANNDLEGLCEGDLAFHLLLAEISDNSILKWLLETVRDMMFNFMVEISHLNGVPQKAMASHRVILQAVADHNCDKAEYEMRHHMLLMIESLRAQYQYEFDL